MSDQTTAAPTAHAPDCELMQPVKVRHVFGQEGEKTRIEYADKPPLQFRCTCQPAAPSTRVTEAELLVLESDAGQLLVKSCPPGVLVNRLVAEIRRYRALLLGLASRQGPVTSWREAQPWDSDGVCNWCGCEEVNDKGKHADGCPWPDLEAEVQAIRAERRS